MDKLGLISKVLFMFGYIFIYHAHPNETHSLSKNKITKAQEESPDVFCVYGNKTYRAGTHFRPDRCTKCRCTKHGGRADCSIEDCRSKEPHCLHYEMTQQSECCATCTQYGCLDRDGTVYMAGDIVSYSPCLSCICPVGGGGIQCTQVTCPQTTCVNPVMDADGCCQRCPNGPNCWLGKRVIPAGRVYKISLRPCKVCQCPEITDFSRLFDGPQAVCRIGARHCRRIPTLD